MGHYIIIIVIIVGIVCWQIFFFINTWSKLEKFRQTFPENNTQFVLGQFEGGEPGIITNHKNSVLETIRDSINNYLRNNKGAVSDYHLIKDIVERNCDAKEDEIDTQIPVPLYLGLVGTMAGILFGVGLLVKNGGLEALLNSEIPKWFSDGFPLNAPTDIIKKAWDVKGAEGVITLLGGVAIAMVSSISGIILTTWGASKARRCKVEVEKNKNSFLSWIQATLLPKLSDGTAAILDKVSRNLNEFNKTFSSNTRELKETFSTVKDTYKDLSSILDAINHLNIKEIAQYNILVYDKMKNTTDEIGALGEHLKGVNQYLSATNSVVQKLDMVFEKEISQFDQRIGAFKRSVGIIDDGIGLSLTRLNENTTSHLDEFIKSAVNLNEKFGKATIDQQNTLQEAVLLQSQLFEDELLKQEVNFSSLLDKQNKALEAKTKEIEVIVTELQNLSAVKTSMGNLERTTKEQNSKLDRLAHSIEKLAQLKVNEGGVINPWDGIPKWVKITSLAISGSIAFAGLFFVVVVLLIKTGVIR